MLTCVDFKSFFVTADFSDEIISLVLELIRNFVSLSKFAFYVSDRILEHYLLLRDVNFFILAIV